jgi:hypothetical protein
VKVKMYRILSFFGSLSSLGQAHADDDVPKMNFLWREHRFGSCCCKSRKVEQRENQ